MLLLLLLRTILLIVLRTLLGSLLEAAEAAVVARVGACKCGCRRMRWRVSNSMSR